MTLPFTYTDAATIFLAQPDVLAVGQQEAELAAGMAESEINGHLVRLYKLPFASVPPLLATLATDIAIYKIFTSRPFSPPPRPQVETPWNDRYKAAVAILLRLASGEMLLTNATGDVIEQRSDIGGAWSSTMNYVPTFGEGTDQGFVVDRNKIEAEESRRF